MQPQSAQEYKQLLTDVIKKQIVILGPDITLSKARNVKGLTVLNDGTVTEVVGSPQEVTQALIDQFVQLSGLIVKKTMEPLLLGTQFNTPQPSPAPATPEPSPLPVQAPTQQLSAAQPTSPSTTFEAVAPLQQPVVVQSVQQAQTVMPPLQAQQPLPPQPTSSTITQAQTTEAVVPQVNQPVTEVATGQTLVQPAQTVQAPVAQATSGGTQVEPATNPLGA